MLLSVDVSVRSSCCQVMLSGAVVRIYQMLLSGAVGICHLVFSGAVVRICQVMLSGGGVRMCQVMLSGGGVRIYRVMLSGAVVRICQMVFSVDVAVRLVLCVLLFTVVADIDECQIGTHECHGTLMQCVNRPGSYMCQCPEGYQINHALRVCEGDCC